MSSTGGPPIGFLLVAAGSDGFLTLQSLFAVDDCDVVVVLLLLVMLDAAVWLIWVPVGGRGFDKSKIGMEFVDWNLTHRQ